MPQALSGSRRSIPKICRINGDDNTKMIYKNLGNNHAVPFLWSDSFTMVSGTDEIVIASGIKFHGYDLATYGSFTVSPMSDVGYRWWIDKNTTTNVVSIKSSSNAGADIGFDVMFMLGVDPDLESLNCRG